MKLTKNVYRNISIILAIVLVITAGFTYYAFAERSAYKTYLQNQYQRAFRDLITNVENIQTLIDKAEVTGSNVQSNTFMSAVWRQSSQASDNLGQLPISHNALSNTAKYLTQVGDYCYTISRQNAADKMMDDDQLKKLKELRDYSKTLLADLQKLQNEVVTGAFTFSEMKKKGFRIMKEASESAVDVQFGKIEKRFVDYPTMIYDGPFSDNKIEGKPKGELKGLVSLEKAKEVAKKFVGKKDLGDIVEYSSGKGQLETYGLELIPKDKNRGQSINIDITKKGGKVLWMLNPREVKEAKLTQEQASEIAKKFLSQNGFPNLEETYYLRENNTTMITYVGLEADGTLVYPDLLKVKVALDNGEVVGFDAYQYIMAHRDREIPKPSITEKEALSKVNGRISVERTKFAIIPLPADREVFCYEFKGKYDNNDYFIYINAENGNEENILRIIKLENGILTQ